MMSRMTVLTLFTALLAVVHAEAENRRGCTAISYGDEKEEWKQLERSVSLRLQAFRLYLTQLHKASFVRDGDISLCNACVYEVVSLKETIASAPPDFLIPEHPGWRESWRAMSKRAHELRTTYVWPACDGKPVDWARFDEVR